MVGWKENERRFPNIEVGSVGATVMSPLQGSSTHSSRVLLPKCRPPRRTFGSHAAGNSAGEPLDQIDRRYERIDERLAALGADIKRVD